MIPETKVKLDGEVTEGTFMTSNDGDYRFEGLEKFNDYTLLPEKDNNYLSGVSTLDLVLIQRHILGVERLNSPVTNLSLLTSIGLILFPSATFQNCES